MPTKCFNAQGPTVRWTVGSEMICFYVKGESGILFRREQEAGGRFHARQRGKDPGSEINLNLPLEIKVRPPVIPANRG